MTSNHHWDIFTQLGPFLCHYIAFLNFEGNIREISMWKYPQGFYRERRWKYPHKKFSFISPEFPQGIFNRDDPLEFPNKSAWKSGGRG